MKRDGSRVGLGKHAKNIIIAMCFKRRTEEHKHLRVYKKILKNAVKRMRAGIHQNYYYCHERYIQQPSSEIFAWVF